MTVAVVVGALFVVTTASCGGSSNGLARSGEGTPTGASTVGSAATGRQPGCAPAVVRRDTPPEWTVAAGIPSGTYYAVAEGDQIAAFFFSDPLRAGDRQPRNKILWPIPPSADPAALSIVARPDGVGAPITVAADAGGGNGEIHRSVMRVPAPGCWRLALKWGSRGATLDVAVEA